MTAARHTPGKWARHGVQHRIVTDRSDGHRVTVAWMADAHDEAIPAAERDANERLIAAAPALLEALEWIVNDAIDPHGDAKLPIEQYDAARAAIAAARGES